MSLIKFTVGAVLWHVRAGFWYMGLVFRLYFAIGLDRSVHPGKEADMTQHFRCPYPRAYQSHLKR